MTLFSFQWNLNLLYVLIYWILNIFLRLSIDLGFDDFYSISKNNASQNEYIFLVYSAISNVLSGFLVLYIKCAMKQGSEVQKKDKIKLIYKNPLNKRDKYFYLKLILISFFDLLHFSFYSIFYLIIDTSYGNISTKIEKDIKTLLDIIIRYLLSIFVLKIKVYKHHIWSILAIIIGFLLIVPIDIVKIFIKNETNKKDSLLYMAIMSLRALFFPLEHTLIKKFYSNYYILPENLLFLMGIIQCILLSILTPILTSTKVFNDDLNYSPFNIIMSILYTLITFVRQSITLKIIYLFSSQSVSFLIISTTISGTIYDIIDFFQKKDKSLINIINYLGFFFGIIAFVFIIFGILVYDEILIINKWGLNLNVKKGIYERSLSEIEENIEEVDDDDKLLDKNEDRDIDLISNEIN